MPNDSTVARCPFYIKSNQTTIYCESNVSLERQEDEPERSYAHIFQNAAKKKNFVKEHCGRYPDMNCPYAEYMEREYAGGSGNEGRAKRQLENQEKMIAGLERGNRYLHGVCERAQREMVAQQEAEKQKDELMLFLMAGCALAAGGAVTIQTENMSRVLEEKRVLFHADFEKHLATVSVEEREQA